MSPTLSCRNVFYRQGTARGIKLYDGIDVVIVAAQEDGDDDRES
ncbi:hypothetical protein [Cellvibrio sp.]